MCGGRHICDGSEEDAFHNDSIKTTNSTSVTLAAVAITILGDDFIIIIIESMIRCSLSLEYRETRLLSVLYNVYRKVKGLPPFLKQILFQILR